jgi:hypothetical protein
MKSMESRKWGQKDKHQLTAKGDLTGFIARLKSEPARVAAVTKADERRPNFIAKPSDRLHFSSAEVQMEWFVSS